MDKGNELQVEKKMLRVKSIIGETVSQMEINKTLSLEEPVKNIRDYNMDVIISSEETEVIEDRVMVKGLVYQQISWMNEDDVCKQHEEDVEFTHYVDVPGAQPGMDVHVDARVVDVDFMIDGRLVEEKKLLELNVKVFEGMQVNVVTDINCPDAQVKTNMFKAENMIGESTALAEIMKEYTFPEGVKTVKDVDVEVMIEKEGIEILTDQVIVKGTVYMDVYYVNEEDEMKHYDIEEPFVKYVKVLGTRAGMNGMVETQVENVEWEADGDQVKLEVVLEVYTKVTECLQVSVVTDVEGEKITVDKELLKLENMIGEHQKTCMLDGNIILYENAKEIMDVDQEIQIDYQNTSVLDDKVIVSGILCQQVYYVNEDDEVCQKTSKKEFTETLEVPGAKPGMNAAIKMNIIDIDHKLEDDNTIGYKVECQIVVIVTETAKMYVVTDATCHEVSEDDKKSDKYEYDEWPSMRFYIVQTGDSLWNIAAKYGITVADIVDANDIDDPDLIFPGQQLFIPCKRR